MIRVNIHGGTTTARRIAQRFGKVKSCRLKHGDSRPTFTPYGKPSRIGGRISVCEVECSAAAGRAVRRAFMRSEGPVLWFDDKCPVGLMGSRRSRRHR